MGVSSEFSGGAKNGCTGDCNAGEIFKINVHISTATGPQSWRQLSGTVMCHIQDIHIGEGIVCGGGYVWI